YLYTVSRIGIATCLEARTGKEIWRQRLGGQPCASMICIRGKIVFLSDDGTASVIEPGPTFKLLYKNKLGDGDEFRASPAVLDGQILIRSTRRLYCIRDLDNKSEVERIGNPSHRRLGGHAGSVLSVAFSPDAKVLASGSRDKTIKLWDPQTAKLEHTLTEHTADVYSVVFSPKGNLMASGSADKTVRLWDAR